MLRYNHTGLCWYGLSHGSTIKSVYDKFCGVEFRVMGASDRALGLKVSAPSASGFRV